MLRAERQQDLVGRDGNPPARQHAPDQLVDQDRRIVALAVVAPRFDSSHFQRLTIAFAPVRERKQLRIELPEHERIAEPPPAVRTVEPAQRAVSGNARLHARGPVGRSGGGLRRHAAHGRALDAIADEVSRAGARFEITVRDKPFVNQHDGITRHPRKLREFAAGRQAQSDRQTAVEHRVDERRA